MIEKIILSEQDYEYLTKGIAIGVGIGTLVGLLLENVILGFASGGVIGIILSFIYSYYKKTRKNNNLISWIYVFNK